MHRLLERLDGVLSNLVPLAYLAGLMAGTVAYFGGAIGDPVMAVALGIGAASECHSFLQSRRARADYGEYRRIVRAGGDVADIQSTFRVDVSILAGLVLFQIFTATAFAAETWHVAPGYLPAWLQIGIRGAVVPVLFLLSGFLVPLHQSAAAVLTRASDEILHTAVRRNVRHWRKRIARVHRRGGDLSPLMVALLDEAGEPAAARRTTLIAENLTTAETHMAPGFWSRLFHRPALNPASPMAALLPTSAVDATPPTSPTRPPTGPGSPALAPAPDASKRASAAASTRREPVLQLTMPPEWRKAKGKRTASAQERVYRVLAAQGPDVPTRKLAKAAKVSDSTASKHRALWRRDHGITDDTSAGQVVAQ